MALSSISLADCVEWLVCRSLLLICIEFDAWNDNLISLEYSAKFAFCFKTHLDLHSSKSCFFSFVWLCSSQTNTCFFFENLSWLGCLHTKSVWQWPSLCLSLFLSAPGYKHWKQKPFFCSSANRYFCVISTNVLHEKYWIILVWFAATWPLSPQNEHIFWVFPSPTCNEPLYPFLLFNWSSFLLYLVVLWSLFFELNFFAGVLLLLFLGIQSAYSIVLHLLIRLHLILSTILLILNLLAGSIFSLNHLHCKAFLWCCFSAKFIRSLIKLIILIQASDVFSEFDVFHKGVKFVNVDIFLWSIILGSLYVVIKRFHISLMLSKLLTSDKAGYSRKLFFRTSGNILQSVDLE